MMTDNDNDNSSNHAGESESKTTNRTTEQQLLPPSPVVAKNNNNNNNNIETDTDAFGLPICCHPDFSNQPHMFRITRSRGKALSSGGFGVAIVVDVVDDDVDKGDVDNDNDNDNNIGDHDQQEKKMNNIGVAMNDGIGVDNNNKSTTTSTTKKKLRGANDFLFLEEVLFLHEQGMLECRSQSALSSSSDGSKTDGASRAMDINPNNSDHNAQDVNNNATTGTTDNCRDKGTRMTSPQLYALLQPCGLSMATYLVFAHLRQQTFRVVRYTPQRLALLRECSTSAVASRVGTPDTSIAASSGDGTTITAATNNKDRRSLHLKLRHDVQGAPPPAVIAPSSSSSSVASSSSSNNTQQQQPTFAFCVYPPDSNFSKTNPGLPAFLVAITYYEKPQQAPTSSPTSSSSGLSFGVLRSLLQQAQGIPIKVATVADSGSVIMFGATDTGVPPIKMQQR